jgi:hypothetical protein
MRAMAAPPAGAADACEAKVNETADAAARANKVIFICFLPTIRDCPHAGRAPGMAPAAVRTGVVNFSLWLVVRFD